MTEKLSTCTTITGLRDGVPAQDCPRPGTQVNGWCVEHAAQHAQTIADAADLFDRL